MNAMSLPAMTMRSVRAWCRTLTVAAFLAGAIGGSAQAASTAAAGDGGKWSHAYAAYGEPKYPRGFRNFDYVNPDAPKGGTLQLQNPDRRTSFDKFNPFTIKGQSPAGLSTLMFETLADALRRRAGHDVRAASPRTCWSRRTSRRSRSASIPRRASPTAIRSPPPTSSTSFDMLTGKGAAPGVRIAARRRRARGRARRAHDPLRPQGPHRTTRSSTSAACRCSRASGGAARTASRRSSTRSSTNTRSPPARTRSARSTAGAASSSRAIPTTGRATWASSQGPVQLRPHRLPLLPGQRDRDGGLQGRRVRLPDGVLGAALGAPARGPQVERRADRQGGVPDRLRHGPAVVRPQPAPAAVPGPARARRRSTSRYDFEAINVYKQYKRTNSVFANSDFAATGLPSPGRAGAARAVPRASCPPAVFGPAWQAAAHRHSPNALRENLKKARALLEEAGWKVGRRRRAAQRQGRAASSSSCWRPATRSAAREAVFERNLAKLGIKLNLRLVDFALYRKRLETFDFDMINIKIGDFDAAQRRPT